MPSTKWGNMKAKCGTPVIRLTAADSTALEIPNKGGSFIVNAASAVTVPSLKAALRPGRVVTLIAAADTAGTIAITDTAYASTAEGLVHLTAALTLDKTSSVTLRQNSNGSWSEVDRAVID